MDKQPTDTTNENWVDIITDELPPWMKNFILNKWKEVLSAILVLILGAAMWTGYAAYEMNNKKKVAAALGSAINIKDKAKKVEALKQVANDNRNTTAGSYAFLILGSVYMDTGQMNLAEESFKKALKNLKKDTVFYNTAQMGLGYIHENEKKYESAKNEYMAGTKRENGYKSIALLDIARIYQDIGLKKEALDAYNQYLSMQKDGNAMGQNGYIKFQISRLEQNN